ncbi:1,4-dihydroxy-2-naphthoate octaprenyltransferase [candidate division KSB1 bacterium]|nr:1,4-dihydroxy-2-naphthoate octaprenyltransferase [candidate division KSB1 bacterium]
MSGKTKIWLQEIRAPFFTGSIIPIVLGTLVAFNQTGDIDWFYFALTLIGGIFLHAGANVSNDYFDHKTSDDDINDEFVRPFTGGSRMIQNGLLSPREVITGALVFFFLAAIIGLYLTFKIGPVILLLGVVGAISGFFYTAPPLYFVSRGVGEILIGLNFGVLMTFGAFYVQAQKFSWQPIIASLPVAFLITAILFINEFQDYRADKNVGKNHWVVRLGKEKAVTGYMFIMFLTYLSLVLGVVTDVLPPISLIGLLTLPLAIKSVIVARNFYNDNMKLVPANASTILNHLLTGLLLSVSLVIDKFI